MMVNMCNITHCVEGSTELQLTSKPATVTLFVYCVYAGKPVFGQSGELVCLKPLPSTPTHFWNDANGKKYNDAYFNKFPGNRF